MEMNDLFRKVLELEKFSNQTLEDANQKLIEIRQSAEKTIQEVATKLQNELKALEKQYEELLNKEQNDKTNQNIKEIELQTERIKEQYAVSLPTITEWFKKEIDR